MANKEAKYDKVLLTLSAIAALGVSGTLYMFKSSFPETLVFPKVQPQKDFGVIPQAEVVAAVDRLQKPYEWVAPVRQNKPVPLNKSVTVVSKAGVLFDLFVENPPLRPPLTNKFLRDNDLEYLSPNVGELDPDGDGFTNQEEFEAGTNPKDPKSHPPVTKHLYFRNRVQNDYILSLQSSDMPVQVRRIKPEPGKSIFVSAMPQEFGFEGGVQTQRFTAEKFEKKVVSDKDVSELTVMDKATNQRVVLIMKVPTNLAEYKAELEFRSGTVSVITPKKGDNFRLTGVAATFKVIDVQEDNATIVQLKDDGTDGEKFVVTRRP